MLRDLSCPNCGAPGLEPHQPDGMVVCKFCGNKFAEDDSIACPECEVINLPSDNFCKSCGQKLRLSCPACGASNWSGAEHCVTCGRDLNALTILAERHARGYRGTLQHQRESANQFKADEARASEHRMAVLKGTEQRRQHYLGRQQAEQRKQQNILFGVTFAVGILFLGSLIAFGIWVLLR